MFLWLARRVLVVLLSFSNGALVLLSSYLILLTGAAFGATLVRGRVGGALGQRLVVAMPLGCVRLAAQRECGAFQADLARSTYDIAHRCLFSWGCGSYVGSSLPERTFSVLNECLASNSRIAGSSSDGTLMVVCG